MGYEDNQIAGEKILGLVTASIRDEFPSALEHEINEMLISYQRTCYDTALRDGLPLHVPVDVIPELPELERRMIDSFFFSVFYA